MSYILKPQIFILFKELRDLSYKLYQSQSLSLSTARAKFDQRELAITELFELFSGLALIFDCINENSELLTPSTIELMKQDDALTEHEIFFKDCLSLFSNDIYHQLVYDKLSILKQYYQELRERYFKIVKEIVPAKERTIPELLTSLELLKVYVNETSKQTSYKLFHLQLDLVIQFFKAIEVNNTHLQPIPNFNLRENLDNLLLYAPTLVHDDLEKINSQLLLSYEILSWKSSSENQDIIAQQPLNVFLPHTKSAVFLVSSLILIFYLSQFFIKLKCNAEDGEDLGFCPLSF